MNAVEPEARKARMLQLRKEGAHKKRFDFGKKDKNKKREKTRKTCLR